MNRACSPKDKHQNSQKWAKFMNFLFWPSLLFGLQGRLLKKKARVGGSGLLRKSRNITVFKSVYYVFVGVPKPGCFKPGCLQMLRSLALFCGLAFAFFAFFCTHLCSVASDRV